jgi:methylmalonyl-CoA mutase
MTTPTAESVRRAMAIQQIIDREFGMAKNENPLQGSYFISELTDLVEEAVLAEFDRLNERGGVLGAMELQYQRSRIQEESLLYELKKDSGELPIIGVTTFQEPEAAEGRPPEEMARSRTTPEEKRGQIEALRAFQQRHQAEAPEALERMRRAAQAGDNLFAELMATVRVASLGQVTHALYEVGGRYRRAM